MKWTMPVRASGSFNKSLAKQFYNLIDPLADNLISISYGKSIINLGYIDALRLLYEHQPSNDMSRVFKNILLKTFSDSERKSAGSGIIAVLSFLKCVEVELNDELEIELKKFSYQTQRGTLKDLHDIIDQFAPDENLKQICNKIIEDGGFSASCDIETSQGLEDTLEIIDASRFNIRLDLNFSSATKINKVKTSYPDIIVADGIIEEVSEIHHILEHYSKTKKYCFLICRGFSNDVINTLSTNYLRGSLRVIPGSLVHNLDSINSLKDICVISGSDLLSTLKGDRFSTLDIKSITQVEDIKLDLECIEIKNEAMYHGVISLIKNLRKQIENEHVSDKKEILEKRISQLSPRKVKISLSNHKKDQVGISKDRIKMLVSLINSSCQFGIIELKENKFSSFLLNDTIEFLNQKGIYKIPAKCFFDGLQTGITNAKMLNSTSQMVLIDSDS